jgi:hypothetical protein
MLLSYHFACKPLLEVLISYQKHNTRLTLKLQAKELYLLNSTGKIGGLVEGMGR